MIRGMGRIVQAVKPMCSSIAGAAWGGGGMPSYASGGMVNKNRDIMLRKDPSSAPLINRYYELEAQRGNPNQAGTGKGVYSGMSSEQQQLFNELDRRGLVTRPAGGGFTGALEKFGHLSSNVTNASIPLITAAGLAYGGGQAFNAASAGSAAGGSGAYGPYASGYAGAQAAPSLGSYGLAEPLPIATGTGVGGGVGPYAGGYQTGGGFYDAGGGIPPFNPAMDSGNLPSNYNNMYADAGTTRYDASPMIDRGPGPYANAYGSPDPGMSQYTNQGFNVDVSQGGFDTPAYGPQDPYVQAQTPPPTLGKPGIGARVLGGAKETVQNLPENFGRALPGIGASLAATALAGGFKKNNAASDPGYEYARQQAETDSQRNQIALGAQKEFTANASKYGSEDYYRQMGDMSSLNYRSGRVQQRQNMARQLAAQGKDPTTINALLQQYDLGTESGAAGARDTSYLNARNSGLSAQQSAAGMFATGNGAGTLSDISSRADANAGSNARNIGNLIASPLMIGRQNEGRTSGDEALRQANQAGLRVTDKYGLDSRVMK